MKLNRGLMLMAFHRLECDWEQSPFYAPFRMRLILQVRNIRNPKHQ